MLDDKSHAVPTPLYSRISNITAYSQPEGKIGYNIIC